ncbi:MAG: cyclodeaminase/cyclohydrolase family protein [Candidatus Thermoplasmatota archaeon]|nr:cyclodeaminase/cyclohydrolase family protein [Candidatus Thermoplasmatota archaeon]
MNTLEELRAFCNDLSSDRPAPGGGTASAAAGSMSASLLVMVCGISLKSRKLEDHWPALLEEKTNAEHLRDKLLDLSVKDSEAYSELAAVFRRTREMTDEKEVLAARDPAVRNATDIPMETARNCLQLLRISKIVAQRGIRSASSDVEVAIELAEAGLRGAAANVRINLASCEDGEYRSRREAEVSSLLRAAEDMRESALKRLRPQSL